MDTPAQAPMSVLLVEDDDAVRESLQLLLANNYTVDAVGHAAAAVTLARRRYQNWRPPYDAVMIDLRLGDGPDGFDCLRWLRAIPGYSCAPTLAFTGWNSSDVVARCRAAGFDEVLIKPFMPEVLERRLELLFEAEPPVLNQLTVA